MEFKQMNHERHAVKHYSDETVSTERIRAILDEAHYAPSGINMQTWHFVIVESQEAREALAAEGKGGNQAQILRAPAVVAIFSDTQIEKRLTEMAKGQMENATQETWREHLHLRYLKEVPTFSEQYKSDYLALNTGFVAMNMMYAVTDAGYQGNFILGFHKTPKINEILKVDKRYRPELLVVFGKSSDKGELHYRKPLDEIIEIR